MILLHQVHSLRPGAGLEFEELTRDSSAPSYCERDGSVPRFMRCRREPPFIKTR